MMCKDVVSVGITDVVVLSKQHYFQLTTVQAKYFHCKMILMLFSAGVLIFCVRIVLVHARYCLAGECRDHLGDLTTPQPCRVGHSAVV